MTLGDLLDLTDVDWMRDAACTTTDPEAFFPDDGANYTYARRICSTCPVRSACLDYALRTEGLHGIWGGLADVERRRLRKDRGIVLRDQLQPCGTRAAYGRHIKAGETPCDDCAQANRDYHRRRAA